VALVPVMNPACLLASMLAISAHVLAGLMGSFGLPLIIPAVACCLGSGFADGLLRYCLGGGLW
jgi:hypothetical protein